MKKILSNLIVVFILIILAGCDDNRDSEIQTYLPETYLDQNNLNIPELIDLTSGSENFDMSVDYSEFEFFNGFKSETLSYDNSGYLGKTIRVKRGQTIFPSIKNNLNEKTTVHWHGLEVNGDNDGAASSLAIIEPGVSNTYELKIDQPAATIWYHPHAHGSTAHQVYSGLSGMFIIEDEFSMTSNLPNNYGIDDIPVILQAKSFDESGKLFYGNENDLLDFEDGSGHNHSTTQGFAIMTNGNYNPYLNVSNRIIRLRMLNASNHGIMDISIGDSPFYVIASDGGFFENPKSRSTQEIVAGQRFEIIIDLGDKSIGDVVDVVANGQNVLSLRIDNLQGEKYSPDKLVDIIPYETYINQESTHEFNLENDLINNLKFDHMVINYTFNINQIYYFEIVNNSRENHSFHIHNARFLVVEFNGDIIDHTIYGWKDTIYLKPGESMKIQIKFHNLGLFMLHCHILIHEEEGMMHKFEVI